MSHPLGRFAACRTNEEVPVDDDRVAVISCDDCTMQQTSACEDCVVTFICNREPDQAVVIDAVEARAVRMLGEAGLVPRLRQVRRTG